MADIEKNIKENEEIIKEQEKSNPGTTNSTDPQEHMEGPVSSFMHVVEEVFESKKDEAEKDKE